MEMLCRWPWHRSTEATGHAGSRRPRSLTGVDQFVASLAVTRRELIAEYAGQSIGSLDVGTLVNSLTAVIYENHLFLPPGVMLLLRMLGELEGTAQQHGNGCARSRATSTTCRPACAPER